MTILGVIRMQQMSKQYKFVVTAMFTAIIFLLTFTPIGFIQLGIIKATIVHVPVILGAILLGPRIGAVLGGMFGFASLLTNTLFPTVLSFVFSPVIPVPGTGTGSWVSLIVCFVPRILVGIFPYYVYRFMKCLIKDKKMIQWLSYTVAGVMGSALNTILVLNLLFLFFHDAYGAVKEISAETVYGAVMLIAAVNGIPEAIVAGILITGLGKVLSKAIQI